MGGRGSGTWYRFDAKVKIEQTDRIDIRRMKCKRMMSSGTYRIYWSSQHDEEPEGCAVISVLAEKGMVITYYWREQSTGVRNKMVKGIRFALTKCHFGGHRQWFVCPACEKRVAVLAFNPPAIACRHCFNLTYSSQNEPAMYRALRRRNKIGDRIGISDEFSRWSLAKPKGMQWKTFERILQAYDDADERSERCFQQWIFKG